MVGGLSASGKNNAWLSEAICAVGTCAGLTDLTGQELRWNGGAWRSVTLPKAYARGIVVPASPTSNWIVGSVVPLPPLPSSLLYTGSGNIAVASQKSVWLEIERTSDVGDSTPYLLHWTGSKWTSIKIPYGLDDMGGAPVAQDGHAGVWLSLTNIKDPAHATSYLLHYLNGTWTRIPVPTNAGYEVLGPVTLTWIPGTRSLWGTAGEWNPKSPKSPGKVLILKYGP